MATCKDCLHWNACKAMLEADGGIRIADDFKGSADRCKNFVSAADVAPRAEVAREIFWEIDMLLMSITIDEEAEESFVGLDFDKYLAIRRKYTKVETEMPKGD